MPDEYISREAAVKYIKSEQCGTCSDIGLCGNCAVLVAVKLLEKVPAADVAEVVHGRWNVVEGRRLDNAICSNCGRHFQAYYEAYRFCPNCGAKMDGAAE